MAATNKYGIATQTSAEKLTFLLPIGLMGRIGFMGRIVLNRSGINRIEINAEVGRHPIAQAIIIHPRINRQREKLFSWSALSTKAKPHVIKKKADVNANS